MCPQFCFNRIIPGLEEKIRNNPSSSVRSQFTAHAFGRTTFIEIAVFLSDTTQLKV